MAYRKLFIDDEVDFYDLRGLEKVLNQPVKHPDNPLLVREHPWEAVTAQLYGTVLYDEEEKLFKMWYLAMGDPKQGHEVLVDGRPHGMQVTAYAESEDGLQWEKPDLGLVSFDGSKRNNILPIGTHGVEGICVIRDRHDPDPARRYKAAWWDHDPKSMKTDDTGMVIESKGGLCVAWSADGIHWTPSPSNPVVPCFSDTGQQLVWDPDRNIYAAFGRLGTGGRVVERSQSEDFETWTDPELVFKPDDMDRMGTQFYGMGVSRYEGLYIGMPWVIAQRLADTRSRGADGRIHVQLGSSRDGIRWQRAGGRRPFIPNGPPDAWDGGIIYTAAAPIVLDDHVLIYYFGSMWPHEPGRHLDMPSGIGLATLRRDGFISLDAGNDEGNFGTVPFIAGENQEIHLNMDARTGRAYARLCDPARCEPLPDLEPSESIYGDHLDVTVQWTKGQMKAVAGKTVAARIYAQRAKFYSYWFAD